MRSIYNIMKIIRYTLNHKSKWDTFVNASKNGTFLHLRNYMDYHSNRFDDFSLLCVDSNENIIALLPANKVGNNLYSHQGLTYGGWITSTKGITATSMIELWNIMWDFLSEYGINRLIYKAIPHIYHRYPSEEDQYAIFRNGGKIQSTLISTTIPLYESRLQFNENARRSIKHATSKGVTVSESTDFGAFWLILSQMLKERHNTSPVHTLDEIVLLHSRFPENIKLYVATQNDEIIGGTVMFFTHTVAHAQYIAASLKGRELKVLPLVFDHIINHDCDNIRYFDFGPSNEDGGMYLNEGLITQKCGMGGRGIVYNTFEIRK